MSDRRRLYLATEDDVIAEVSRLRKGNRQRGNWTLAQIAWHLSSLIERFLNPPASPDAKRSAEQDKMKAGFVDYIIANRRLPDHAKNAGPFTPPATAGDPDIERFISELKRMKAYPHALVEMGPIGPVPTNECRTAHLVHAEHHLSFLEPTKSALRPGLTFANEDAVVEDVQTLRRGYAQARNWSLPQMCWHLNIAVNARMQPGPHSPNTPEQNARAAVLREILATGQLPHGIETSAPMVPPVDADDKTIDALIESLGRLKRFPGPIAPHRLFGHMTDADARRVNLIHCAHHLQYLVPLEKTAATG